MAPVAIARRTSAYAGAFALLAAVLWLPSAAAAGAACSDGIDNDGDGFTDYPSDPACTDPNDATEAGPLCFAYNPAALTNACVEADVRPSDDHVTVPTPKPGPGTTIGPICIIGSVCPSVPVPVTVVWEDTEVPLSEVVVGAYVEPTGVCSGEFCRLGNKMAFCVFADGVVDACMTVSCTSSRELDCVRVSACDDEEVTHVCGTTLFIVECVRDSFSCLPID